MAGATLSQALFNEDDYAFTSPTSTARTTWLNWAKTAWKYFAAGVGVETATGLPHAGLKWPYFTEWDLATYIFAILDAAQLGILSKTGTWGADYRINRIIAWLQTRALTPDHIPYLWYDARNGAPALGNQSTNVSDHGGLLIALHLLKEFRPDLTSTINQVVLVLDNTQKLASDPQAWRTTGGLYAYYVAQGFRFFGFAAYPPVSEALNNLREAMGGPQLDVYGVSLPQTDLTTEPLLLGMFVLDPDPVLAELTYHVFLAHERRSAATGKFVGFSEGNTGLDWPSYVYEWVVTSSGDLWRITPAPITPIIYLKVLVGFEALFHSPYPRNAINSLLAQYPDFTYGFYDGIDESGRLVNTIIDRTNGIILSAARFAVNVLATPTLDKYPSPFINSVGVLSTTFIIGDTNPHGPTGWRAYTIDLVGANGVAAKLGRRSTSGEIASTLDTAVTTYDPATGLVEELWNKVPTSNVIAFGSSAVNTIAYDYSRFGAIPFYWVWREDRPTLHSDLTGQDYTFGGNVDYAVIAASFDRGKHILTVWGLTANGTLAASLVLQYYDTMYAGMLSRRAVLLRWVDSNLNREVDIADSIILVETW